MIAHRIYKSRANKYGDILTVFNILSLRIIKTNISFYNLEIKGNNVL